AGMLGTIDVIGATVVMTCSFPPPRGPLAAAPAVLAAAGQENFATFVSAAERSSFDQESARAEDALLPHAAKITTPTTPTRSALAECYAAIAASTLAHADPAHAAYYRANLARYAAKIDRLDQLMRDATAAMPAKNRELLTYHDAYAYFAAH